MRYTKEFKIECVKKYLNREYISYPGGCTHKTFYCKILHWAKIYTELGEDGFEHNKPKLSFEDKLEIVNRVNSGETFEQVSISYGRQGNYISKLYTRYLRYGLDGLKFSKKRGRPPSMNKKEKKKVENLTDVERIKELEGKVERLEIENEYLKKLSALVQKRKAQQQKKE
jgi:transposase-like protein